MPTYFMKSPKALCPRALPSLEHGGSVLPENNRAANGTNYDHTLSPEHRNRGAGALYKR